MRDKHFTAFYTQFQRYMSSNEYINQCKVFNSIAFSSQILTSVMFNIQSKVLEEKACGTEQQYDVHNVFPVTDSIDTSAESGKVRYVGAYCIAKTRHNLCPTMKNHLFVPGMEIEIQNINQQIKLLDGMILTATEILAKTKYQETLQETARKQNMREGLTNINDEVFEFFLFLQKEIEQIMTYTTLMEQNKHLFKYVSESLLEKRIILEMF